MGKKSLVVMHTDLYTAEEWYKLTQVEKTIVMQQVKALNTILVKKTKTPEEEAILNSFEELHSLRFENNQITKIPRK